MPSTIVVPSTTGTDGQVPIYQPNNRWQIWNLIEIYTGGVGANRYVPNVNDYVVNTSTGETWKVSSVDPTTLIPTLVTATPLNTGGMSSIDTLLGVGPGTQSDTYRVYIDKSVIPHTLAVDARLMVCGSMVKNAIIYRGSMATGNEVAISGTYDQTGKLLGQTIPLETVAIPTAASLPALLQWLLPNTPITNIAVMTVPVCYTMSDLPDGEVVTVVFYSDTGNVVSKRQLLVENTAFIRNPDRSVKYITSIALESPFISSSNPTLIQFPLNVPVSGLMLTGVVNYSDGSQLRMPVDGTKFKVSGFEGFLSTIIGQPFSVVLKYTLGANEVVYNANNVGGPFITNIYKAQTTKIDNAYTVKLFGYPVWIDAVNGYRMEWFMYNLDRSVMYLVTPFVKVSPSSPAFNPTLYGVIQHLIVDINLNDVSGTYTPYNFTQAVDITLLTPGKTHATNWTIGYAPNQSPAYGVNTFAISTFTNQNYWTLDLTSGAVDLPSWLNLMYYSTMPLFDSNMETAAPAPNFFALLFGNQTIEFPIAEWNTVHQIANAVPDGSTVFIKWIYRTPLNDQQLAISGITVYQH